MQFRCYLLNSADHIVSVDGIETTDDADAMMIASALLRQRYSRFSAMEIWQEKRCIGRIANEAAKKEKEIESLAELLSGRVAS
jgi:hypothetical protein